LFFKKPLAFIQRDFINEANYKLAFSMQLFGIPIYTLTFFFSSKSISPKSLKAIFWQTTSALSVSTVPRQDVVRTVFENIEDEIEIPIYYVPARPRSA